jgi:hypothetical protein
MIIGWLLACAVRVAVIPTEFTRVHHEANDWFSRDD